jgi:hypothetical protein
MVLATGRRRRLPATTPSTHLVAWRRLPLCWERRIARARATPVAARILAPQQHFHTLVRVHVSAPSAQMTAAPALAPAPKVDRLTSRLVERIQVQRATHTQQQVRIHSAREVWRHHTRKVLEHRTQLILPMTPARSGPVGMTARMPAVATIPRTAPAQPGFDAVPPQRIAMDATDGAARTVPIRRRPEAVAPVAYRHQDRTVLIWQKAAQAEASADDRGFTRSSSLSTPATRATPRGAALPSAADSPLQIRHIARETQRALLLDPAVTDRLAEDVMRRVDKRLRIERERRGL